MSATVVVGDESVSAVATAVLATVVVAGASPGKVAVTTMVVVGEVASRSGTATGSSPASSS